MCIAYEHMYSLVDLCSVSVRERERESERDHDCDELTRLTPFLLVERHKNGNQKRQRS